MSRSTATFRCGLLHSESLLWWRDWFQGFYSAARVCHYRCRAILFPSTATNGTMMDHGVLAVGNGTLLFKTGVFTATRDTILYHGVLAVGNGTLLFKTGVLTATRDTILYHGVLAVGNGTLLFKTGVLTATRDTILYHGVLAVGNGRHPAVQDRCAYSNVRYDTLPWRPCRW